MRRSYRFHAVWIALLAAAAPAARAIVVVELAVPRLINADVPVAPSGVLVFRYDGSTFEPQLDPDAVSIAVVDDAGQPVAGALEQLTAGAELLPTHGTVRIWRPERPFLPSARYTVTKLNLDTGETGEDVFETHAIDPDRVLERAQVSLTLYADLGDRGEPSACCEGAGGADPHCFAPVLVPEPRVNVGIDVSSGDPGLRQLFVDVSPAGFDAESDPVEFAYAAELFKVVPFAERRDSYCIRVEVYDAVARARGAVREVCVDDDVRLFADRQPQPMPAFMIYDDLDVSRCRVPPAGFEAAWCTANEGACFFSDSPGCESFFEVCPHYEGRPRPDAGVQHNEDPMVHTDAGEPGDPGADKQLRTAGCGCELKPGATATWPTLLVLAALVLRRTRAAKARQITRS